MRILVFGRNGQLGRELHRLAQPLGEVTALDVEDLDLGDVRALRRCLSENKPQLILNAAAYTAVDRAESQPGPALAVNAHAPEVMADYARKQRAVLVHYSTDYVFDGRKGSPYREDDPPNPLNAYGRSKLAGEQAVTASGAAAFIFRTSWVYSLHGEGFVSKVLAWSRQQQTLRVVSDQVGSPTWARLLAQATLLVLARCGADPHPAALEKGGLYHLAGGGQASRYEWAQAILEADPRKQEQVCTRVEPASTADFPAPAERPAFSALECKKYFEAFTLAFPPWQETLQYAMNENF